MKNKLKQLDKNMKSKPISWVEYLF